MAQRGRPKGTRPSEEKELATPEQGSGKTGGMAAVRDRLGRFQAGHAPNPSGRNQYTGRKAFQNGLLDFVDVGGESKKDRSEIWAAFIRLARRGDAWAVREFLERRWPVQKGPEQQMAVVVIRDYTGRQHEQPPDALVEVRTGMPVLPAV